MRSKVLIAIGVALCLGALIGKPLHAQSSHAQSSEYSLQAVEELRTELLNLVDAVQEVAALAPRDLVDSDSLQQARVQIQQMPAQSIHAFGRAIDPAKLRTRLPRARTVIREYSQGRPAMNTYTNMGMTQGPMPLAFPVATGACTSANGTDVSRIPTAVVLAADVVWFAADTTRELAQDGCKQDAVVLGEGGNASAACIPVDIVWVVAKAVDEGIHFCDDDLTGAVIDANYARLAFINDEIGNLQGSVNGVDTHLTNVDTHIAAEFVALDTHITALLAVLQTSVNQANQALLKSIAVQTQIMKLDLTPERRRVVAPSILSCTGSDCPNVLANCTGKHEEGKHEEGGEGGKPGLCSWEHVGPLP